MQRQFIGKLASSVLALGMLATACTNDDVTPVGSVRVKSQKISATQGGTMRILVEDDAQLAGTRIDIPPGALATDTEVWLSRSDRDVEIEGATVAGPALQFGPEGTPLSTAARVTVPYDGNSVVRIHLRDSQGNTQVVPTAALSVSRANHLVSFDLSALLEMAPAVVNCTASADCPAGFACVDALCQEGMEVDANGIDDDGDGYIDEGTACAANADCADAEICYEALCQPLCLLDVECPYGLVCDNGLCNMDPTSSICGNAIVEQGEACDDGNDVDTDGCTNFCRLVLGEDLCGNGIDDDGNGLTDEGCECSASTACNAGMVCSAGACLTQCESDTDCPALNHCNVDSGLCVSDDATGVCGNAIVEAGEMCDDGNSVDDDGCNNQCTFGGVGGEICGNGIDDDGDGQLDNGCSCTMNVDCPAGHTCTDSACVLMCVTSASCPTDMGCVSGMCIALPS